MLKAGIDLDEERP